MQDCSRQQYEQAQALFTTLNTDIAAYPPTPIKDTMTRMAAQAESLYPPVPQRPSDFCPSDGMFGRLANYTQRLLNAYPPVRFFPPNRSSRRCRS